MPPIIARCGPVGITVIRNLGRAPDSRHYQWADAGVSEWLGAGLQNLSHGFESRRSLHRKAPPRPDMGGAFAFRREHAGKVAQHRVIAVCGGAERVFRQQAEVFAPGTGAPAAGGLGAGLVEVDRVAALIEAEQGVAARILLGGRDFQELDGNRKVGAGAAIPVGVAGVVQEDAGGRSVDRLQLGGIGGRDCRAGRTSPGLGPRSSRVASARRAPGREWPRRSGHRPAADGPRRGRGGVCRRAAQPA